MVWFAFAIAVVAIFQKFLLTTPGDGMGPILYRNHYAVFIEVVLPIALYRSRDSLLYAGMAAAMFASVVASGSRAGTVLVTAEVILIPLLLRAYSLRAGILVAAFTSVVGWGVVWNRFWLPDPVGIRRDLIASTLQMIAAHPWFGIGLGTWPVVYRQYALVDIGAFANQAHCDWLQWTSEGGILFGIMMVTLFVWCLRPAFRSIWGIGVVAVFLHAVVDYPFSRPALGSWAMVLLAMIAERY
jgi:O-antigen ligase